MCMQGAPFDYKNRHRRRAVGTAGLPHCLLPSPLGLRVVGVGWGGVKPGLEVEPFKPLAWALSERSYHH